MSRRGALLWGFIVGASGRSRCDSTILHGEANCQFTLRSFRHFRLDGAPFARWDHCLGDRNNGSSNFQLISVLLLQLPSRSSKGLGWSNLSSVGASSV